MVKKTLAKRRNRKEEMLQNENLATDTETNEPTDTRKKGKWTSKYRANMPSIVSFEDINLRPPHYACLRRTPFYHLGVPFAKHKLSRDDVPGTQNGTFKIMTSYSKTDRAFHIGGKNITITPQDCKLIFGIQSGNTQMTFDWSRKPQQGLAARRFAAHPSLHQKTLKHQLLQCVDSDNNEDIEDVVRLMILHLMSTVLFNTSAEIEFGGCSSTAMI
ncbi:PREDICTED: uncharacterized protein LOC105976392 [Erythranthe guttata]|uniref:uncharacterized protein LOC105976392 n=1 Tax=Erythranthe guttata TaxID=4155 RepID=UPI00064D974C|nr:PREDICTED: uncharacterized protein LOC105976392 [Erythranthe guttata]|eukprot:XP_012857122.1 PREDICTED: uncharacterized protein LOC105976392 [Erythranthe guttata]